MTLRLLAASAAAITLALTTPTFAADDAAPASNADSIAQDTYNIMSAMMDFFNDAFARAGIEEEKTKATLMARIDASIADYLNERNQDAFLQTYTADFSSESRARVEIFFDTPEGQELFGSLPVNTDVVVPLTAENMTHEEHVDLMDAIVTHLRNESNGKRGLAKRADRLADAIHELDQELLTSITN
ncbi:MAG: hypothetical protein AAFR65_11290 [Pseudomonadota bacterium]